MRIGIRSKRTLGPATWRSAWLSTSRLRTVSVVPAFRSRRTLGWRVVPADDHTWQPRRTCMMVTTRLAGVAVAGLAPIDIPDCADAIIIVCRAGDTDTGPRRVSRPDRPSGACIRVTAAGRRLAARPTGLGARCRSVGTDHVQSSVRPRPFLLGSPVCSWAAWTPDERLPPLAAADVRPADRHPYRRRHAPCLGRPGGRRGGRLDLRLH